MPANRPEAAADLTDLIASSPPINPGRARGAADSKSSSDQSSGGARDEPKALPNLGEKIDEFRLVESIGAGGMGAVFRAVDVGLDRQVALKILPPEQAVDPEVVRRYHQEGRAAARLDHENIARVYTIGDDGRYHYIAFEYIEGVTIRQKVIRDGPLPVADAVHFTLQIAHALVHAAEREVVHRDIKPSNIIITPAGRAKLVDMGLARQFERRGEADLTQTGMTLGTFDYISPEQARDPRDVDIRGDLYSLGCTLFHMLSGRPPFPDGTVLQKLIQHREEAPPDIRRLNPSVPDALAAILVKLLVKDREHRYQTPSDLARDLGAIGTRRIRSVVLPSSRVTPNWARHLFWGGPGLVFLLVLGGMVWWGDGPRGPVVPLGFGGGSPPPPGTRTGGSVPFAPGAFSNRPSGSASARAGIGASAPPESAPPREVAVSPTDDLARILAEAPPRSTILLAERGPYELRASRPIRIDRGDLTIRAEAGVRPVIRLSRDVAPPPPLANASNAGSQVAALVEVRGGRVTFDGVEFLVDPTGFEAAFGGDRPPASPAARVLAAISAEDAEVVVRRCSFRRSGGSVGSGSGPLSLPNGKVAAIRVHASARVGAARGDAPGASLAVDASDFDGHQVGLLVSGPVDVSLRDVAFGPTLADQASIWSDHGEGATTPAEFRLDHVSGLLGPGPMFRFLGSTPRILTRHSVFGPVPTTGGSDSPPTATLVAVDFADRLDWRGGDNLYARLGVFLRPGGPRPQPSIRNFDAWADDPTSFRESGSTASDGALWERLPIPPLTPAAPESPRTYRLALPRSVAHHPGARWGPTGPLPTPTWLASAAPSNRTIPLEPPGASNRAATTSPSAPALRRPSTVSPDFRDDPVDEAPTGLAPMPMPTPSEPDPPSTDGPGPVAGPGPGDSPSIRSTAQFLAALKRDEPGGRTLILAAGADLDLPGGRLADSANWTIRAERGATRPRIRFLPEPADAGDASGWSAWMVLRSGGLRVEGVDLVLPAPLGRANRPSVAFAVRTGAADLALTDCTVTIEGGDTRSAVVAVLAGDDPVAASPFDYLFGAPVQAPPPSAEARVRFVDCLIRSAGDLIDVAPGRAVELDLENTVVAAAGVLVHAHGREEGRTPGSVRVALRRVATWLTGGLLHLETDRDRPNLPVASVQASDSILALGSPETPLIRVDGQGDLASLRDRVVWQGRSVAYHRINTYRLDRTTRPGIPPGRVDRNLWESSLGPADDGAIRGDLGFLDEASLTRPGRSIRAEDWRLRSTSPAAALGPDLLHIPDPPPPAIRS